MYLKSIEVQGFKSFANKIVFDFHNGITAIVGPNGSGKSNVADAVRWVLGEQRAKQLRGGSMQDVIFSGTENRKPLSYASVAITLDNSDHQLSIDYDEVTVTRKIFRSGESEYLINGSACRLKDINELFYDTGIGKEGYSIIGQGQIEKILSGKPEERRELFDEAAGIVKFKRRKNMSVKKLEEERQNLVRVTDILSELEKQIGPLEEQSKTAKIYLNKKEELKKCDINMFLIESTRLKDQISETERLFENAKAEFDSSGKEYEKTKNEYERIEDQLDLIESSMEKANSQLNKTHLLKNQLENQIELLKEQINSAKMSDEHFAQRSNAITEELKKRAGQKKVCMAQKEELQKELDLQTRLRDGSEKELVDIQNYIVKITTEIEKNKNEIIANLNSRASTRAKIQHYDTMMDQMKSRKAQMNQRLIDISSNISAQKELVRQYTEELKIVTDNIYESVQETRNYDNKLHVLQKELKEKEEQFRHSQTSYHREESRLESLKNIAERYDGYGNSIRKVMEMKTKEKGLIGVVADIIKVDKKYETAIETALGGSIQNIVTDNEETAKRMITYLKQNRFGRATFLPLTSMIKDSGFRQKEVLKEEGVIGQASSLVYVEQRFQGLLAHLLGRTIVVTNIDHGIFLARKYKQSLRIVTIEGELINPGGAMTGGAFKNAGNLLGRNREIEELQKKVFLLKNEMERSEETVQSLREKQTKFHEKIDQIKQRLQDDYVRQNTLRMKLDQAEAKKKEASMITSDMKDEGIRLEEEFVDLKRNQESIQIELSTSEDLEKKITKEIQKWQEKLEDAKDEEMLALQKSESVHLILSNLEQKESFIIENITRIDEETLQFENEFENLKENKEHSSSEIEQKEKQIQDLKMTIDNSKGLFAEIEKEIEKIKLEKEELTQKNKTFLTLREDLSKKMSDLDKECFRLNSKKETFEEMLDQQIDYMWNEYEITYSRARQLRDESMTDHLEIRRRIQTLKSEIRQLGNVNVNAIDDYKNVSERYEFLNTQHHDLVEAEKTLVQIIDELDEAMRKQFKERFKEIKDEFDRVFKQLFGGGKGTLELMEDEDILEAGIKIIAQPPGKKLQNMMQLSGGEKALTAISLLFAIQNLKPSPFCLLDEIEAALDDSNVTRFSDYLKTLSSNTQFIIITHRRGTMAAADRLYGITMQEKGISTLVSVDLLENDLTK